MAIGFGIIGAGQMGAVHAAAIDAVSEAQLIAVADVDAKRADILAGEHGLQYVFTDYNHLLALRNVDAVVIATPDQLHCEPAVASSNAGKHVLLEKPIATNLRDADRIIASSKAANVKLAIGHC